MNLVYAALLLHSADKELTEENLKKVAEATGENVEDAQIKALVAALDGVNIEEAISKAAVPIAAPAAVPAAEDSKEEETTEEKDEEEDEKKAEEAAEGLSSLFG